MHYDRQARAKRIEAAALRGMKLQPLIDALEYFNRCDLAHARTNREDDYLDLLQAEHELTHAVEAVTCWDLCAERERIEEEARSECAYDMGEGCFLDDNDEPILPGRPHTPRGYADHLYEQRRDGELGL